MVRFRFRDCNRPQSKSTHTLNVIESKCLAAFFDFIQGVKFSTITSGTCRGSGCPGFRRKEILRPKWPRSALNRSFLIDPATTSLVAQEHAVAVGVFLQRPLSGTHRPNKHLFENQGSESHFGGNVSDLFGRNPDVTRAARATTTTNGTFKVQALFIPRHDRFGHDC